MPRSQTPLPRGRGSDYAAAPLWLEGRCLELNMTTGYSLFLDLLREYFGSGAEAGERERVERLQAALQTLVDQGDLTADPAEEMAPLLGNLFSLRSGTDWDLRLKNASPEQVRHQTLLAVRDFLVALAGRQPLVLVCEDLHWADRLSLDLLALLMEAVPLAPLMLLCVYRPERDHPCWRLGSVAAQKCAEQYTELPLRELTPPQSRRLVESLLRLDQLPAAVRETILAQSRGNPFFLEEIVRRLIEAGTLYRDGEVWRAQGPETGDAINEKIQVPESLRALILSRVDRLQPEVRKLLQSASVIGRLFRSRLLEQLADEALDLPRLLWDLEERGLIYQERVVPEEEYSFKHVLTQEAIYGSLLRRQQAVLHQQVGETIERLYRDELEEQYEQLAFHYERSEADEKAVEYLLKAAEKERRAYLNEAAIGELRRALERLTASPLGETRKEWRLQALQGLGQIYHGIGRGPEAEDCFRQAIAVGQEIGAPPRVLVRLYYWLGDVMYWQNRLGEMARIGEEGRALLGEDTTSVEAALMNHTLAAGYGYGLPDPEKYWEFSLRNVPLLETLPYSEELRPAHDGVAITYAEQKNIEAATRWLEAFERKAVEHHDLRAVAEVHAWTASLVLVATGDIRGALSRHQQARELFAHIGDIKNEGMILSELCADFLRLGELPQAAVCAEGALRSALDLGMSERIAWAYIEVGRTALCQGDRDKAHDAFRRATERLHEAGTAPNSLMKCRLGQAYAGLGERQEAVRQLEAAASLAKEDESAVLAAALCSLEGAVEDRRAFLDFCRRLRAERPEASTSHFIQWFLQPTEPNVISQHPACDRFVGPLSPDWVWHDLFGDCSFQVRNGLEIRAANGRDLWRLNLSAPRLLRPIAGDFAAQTVSVPASAECPAMGGILIWKDPQNFLRLDKGTREKDEISFTGCIENKDLIVGRGRLPCERVCLRLERLGSRVNALCSADGRNWFTVGHVEFAVDDPMQVGLHAIGNIDRLIYPGAYSEGTAIRFESFSLWRE
jgi:tetratricopeptide (TPR) repeat protein